VTLESNLERHFRVFMVDEASKVMRDLDIERLDR
jgi:hypothetical protein